MQLQTGNNKYIYKVNILVCNSLRLLFLPSQKVFLIEKMYFMAFIIILYVFYFLLKVQVLTVLLNIFVNIVEFYTHDHVFES